jgi:RNA binding exosome subunit
MARGRKQKYGEPTEVIRMRVPRSKVDHFIKLVKDELKEYETDKSATEAKGSQPEDSGENRKV